MSAVGLAPDPQWALFLDVDGTLLHLAETPDTVRCSSDVLDVLSRLSKTYRGAVALISGRKIENLDQLFAPLQLPSAGLHGLEHRGADGHVTLLGEARALEHLRAPLHALAESRKGLIFEDKGRALALHFRQAPKEAARIAKEIAHLTAASPDLILIHGKMVIEIKPRHADKGSALRAFMAEAPFAGRVPVFLGDDTTDEDGFAAVNAMGGVSIHIDHEGPPKQTAASYRLSGVDGALQWLSRIADPAETVAEEQFP
jgi:trehalose 6-phosphate phosphatase